MTRRSRWIAFGVSALLAFVATREARAQALACDALPNALYVEAGDTQEPLLKTLGQKLANSTVNPMTVVYNTTGSCTLINDMYSSTKLKVNLKYAPSTTQDPTWDTTKPSPTCTIPLAGIPIDVAISALFVASCTQVTPPAGIGLIAGPIQAYTFIVPKASTQNAIVAEEAYFVFGFGAAGQAQPWIDPAFAFIRPITKSTLLTLAANIGVPAAKWKGTPFDKSTDLLNAVATSASPEKTIGILGAEIADPNRNTVTVLAFRAYNQRHGFFPDSSATAFDKKNLRDGHYLPWSPTVYLTAVDASNVPTNARAKYFIDLVLGHPITPAPDVDGLAAVISKGLIPDCAMKVSRPFDGADLSLYSPAEPCGCYFESKTGTAPASCVACTDSSTCNGGQCRHGYCEAK